MLPRMYRATGFCNLVLPSILWELTHITNRFFSQITSVADFAAGAAANPPYSPAAIIDETAGDIVKLSNSPSLDLPCYLLPPVRDRQSNGQPLSAPTRTDPDTKVPWHGRENHKLVRGGRQRCNN